MEHFGLNRDGTAMKTLSFWQSSIFVCKEVGQIFRCPPQSPEKYWVVVASL